MDATSEGELEIDLFMKGVLLLRGAPTSMDIRGMSVQVKGIGSRVLSMEKNVRAVRALVEVMASLNKGAFPTAFGLSPSLTSNFRGSPSATPGESQVARLPVVP